MNSKLRSRIAAAGLALASVGALVTAQPASAQVVVAPGASPAVVVPAIPYGHDRHDGDRFHRDDRAPAIYDMTPSQGDRVSERGFTRISARFNDERSGVDPRDVRLRIDGRDVTRRARIDHDDIRYADDLRPGRHFAELQVRDRAGNVARQAWSFQVVGHGWGRDRDFDHDHDRR